MKITRSFIAASISVTTCIPVAAQRIGVAGPLKERGATDAELRQVARSPSPAVVPVTFFEQDGMAPSCGVLVAAPGAARSRYIDILSAENGTDVPQRIAIPSIGAFSLHGRNSPQIQVTGPSGIAVPTPASALFASGATGKRAAGQDINAAAQGAMHYAVNAGINLFTYGKAASEPGELRRTDHDHDEGTADVAAAADEPQYGPLPASDAKFDLQLLDRLVFADPAIQQAIEDGEA